MNAAAEKCCAGCNSRVADTIRICPRCGGRVFSAAMRPAQPPAAAGAVHPPLPTPGAPSNTPTPALPRKAAMPAVPRRTLGPPIPLVQARLLGRWLVLGLVAVVAVVFGLVWVGKGAMAEYLAEAAPPEEQRQITERHPDYRKAMAAALPDDHPLAGAVTDIGQRLVGTIPGGTPFRYRFHVVDRDEINAFAMPGGEIFVMTGLLRQFPDPGQVAAVLAHEIQHVERRHATKKLLESLGSSVLFGLVLGVFNDDSLYSAVKLTTLSYSRGNETEADLLGRDLLEAAGYSRQSMVAMLMGLAALEARKPPEWLSSHPDSRERARRVGGG